MDINEIKNRLEAFKSKDTKYEKVDRTKTFWKAPVGKQTIRVVPSIFNKSNPFREIFVHYGVGKFPMLALTNYGEKDPIVEFANVLKNSGDKESWKAGKKLEPKMRVFVPVIVRGEEEMGTRLWEIGKALYMEFLSMAEDDDIGDYTSVSNGRDFQIDTVGKEVTGNYNKSSIRPKTKETSITEDSALLKTILEDQPDILTVYPKKTYDEMKELLEQYLTSNNSEESEESEDTEEPIVEKKSSTDKFDVLFNKIKS